MFFFNLFLALAILKLYLVFSKNVENKAVLVVLLVSTFMLFYGSLITEVLLLNEAMIFALGILLVVLSADRLAIGGIKNDIISLILMILGVTCYQGIACYFFLILLLILMSLKTDDKEKMVNLFKKIGIGMIIYGVSFLTSLGIVQLANSVFDTEASKFGEFDLIANFVKVFTNLLPSSLKNLFGFINVKYYYILVFIMLILIIYLFIKSDNKVIKGILFVGVLLSTIIMPFVPNFVMPIDSNYTASRMALTLGILPSVFTLYILFNYEINIKWQYVIGVVALLFILISVYSIHQNLMINFKRYKQDVSYINSIVQAINVYENKTDNKIKRIYYAQDSSVNYYYSFGHPNGANIRLLAVDWALDCAFPVYTYDKYEFKKISDKDYKKYFKDKNYDEFDNEQLVFDDDTLYLLLY